MNFKIYRFPSTRWLLYFSAVYTASLFLCCPSSLANRQNTTSSKTVNAHILKTLDYEYDKKYNLALKEIDQIRDMETLIWRARILYQQKKYEEALKLCNIELRKYPEEPQALWMRAFILDRLGKHSLAKKDREISSRGNQEFNIIYSTDDNTWIKSEIANHYGSMGNSFPGDGNFDLEAEYAINKAISIDPRDDFYYTRQRLYFEERKFQEALNDLNILISHKPNDADLYFRRSYCLDRIGKHDLAKKDREKASSDPYFKEQFKIQLPYTDQPQPSKSNFDENQIRSVILEINKRLSKLPSTSSGRISLLSQRAQLYYAQGNYPQVIKELEAYYKFCDSNNSLEYARDHFLQADAYRKLNQFDLAIKEYSTGLKNKFTPLALEAAKAHFARGICYQALHREKEASSDFEEARQLGFAGPNNMTDQVVPE